MCAYLSMRVWVCVCDFLRVSVTCECVLAYVCFSMRACVCVCDFLHVSVTCECDLACVCFNMRVGVCDFANYLHDI